MALFSDNKYTYILDKNGKPKLCTEADIWARKYETQERRLAYDELLFGVQRFVVSTVFLGMDHNLTGSGLPVLFETMVFVLEGDMTALDEYTRRYTSKAEALRGHKQTMRMVKLSFVTASNKFEKKNAPKTAPHRMMLLKQSRPLPSADDDK